METIIPKTSDVLSSLLRADFTTQWRNRRSLILLLLVPIIILLSWKSVINQFGGPFVLSTCITIGLVATGLMGYSNSVARDRDKGVFQRLRVAPMPSWCIMASRLMIQLAMILLLTAIVLIAGKKMFNITLSPAGYALSFLTALIGGGVYLGLGQLIVGLIQNPETVNSTSRLTYFAFIMVGTFGETGVLGHQMKEIVMWSPYGVVKRTIAASMQPSTWNAEMSIVLLLTIGYAAAFSIIGIRKFKWSGK
ncbi:MAG TPA: ABC transporter permease [Chitinophagaceae bacterium]|jgi:ABC-2 type transport system permease protein